MRRISCNIRESVHADAISSNPGRMVRSLPVTDRVEARVRLHEPVRP